MHVTVEISLYPLTLEYKDHIKDFIKKLNTYSELDINTTEMSTYVEGPYEMVMETLTVELKSVFEHIPQSAVVIKLIPKSLGVSKGFLKFH